MTNIKDVLHQFKLDIKLPKKVLELPCNGVFNDFSIETQNRSYKTSNGQISIKPFKCYIFEGEEDMIILCPSNPFQICSILKHYKGMSVGNIYDTNANITGRY